LDLVAAPHWVMMVEISRVDDTRTLIFLSGGRNRLLDRRERRFCRRFIRGIQRDTGDTHRKKEDLGVGRPDLDRGNMWVVAPNLPV
jgi:hypothetical protein